MAVLDLIHFLNKKARYGNSGQTKEINLTTGVYHMNNQQLSASLERAWETERENKETEALFEGNKHDED
ncbi:hypothetical protein PS406_00240 [Pediococcus acidilactici]